MLTLSTKQLATATGSLLQLSRSLSSWLGEGKVVIRPWTTHSLHGHQHTPFPTSWCPDIIHPLHVWAVPLQRGGRLQSSWMLLSQKRERRREDTGEELPLPLCLQGIQSLGP